MSEDRFELIETKVAYQEELLRELNEVITRQDARLGRLEELCGALVERIRDLPETLQSEGGDEKPPHY